MPVIANGALIAWPVVALVLFMIMPAWRATIWTILAGYLLLPVGVRFDFQGVPSLDKSSIPSLAAAVLAPIMARSGEFRWPKGMAVNGLMLLYVLVPFATAFTNREPISIGSSFMPGLGFKEGLSSAAGNAIDLVPFVLGSALLGREPRHRDILVAFVLSALIYSLPILAEIRLSPFLQGAVYGVSDTEMWLQQIRSGGYRSMVFLGHGLLVSTFCALALLAAIGLWRLRMTLFAIPMSLITVYLAVILLLNKSMGAVILVVLIAPLFVFLRPRQFLLIATTIATLVFVYPAIRGTSMLPLEGVANAVASFSPERAHSFQFRLDNEQILLDRASQKPLFGWGTYGRNRVIVLTDWGGTLDISVTDGAWVNLLGIYGWLGYLSCFGLLAYPFWSAFRRRHGVIPTATIALLALHLLGLLDLIPNASIRPMGWLVAGAIVGWAISPVRTGGRRPRPVPASSST